MKTNEKQIKEWMKQYYHLVFRYAGYVCHDSVLAERIAEQTFIAAYNNVRKIRRTGNPKAWILQTARYFILKEIYSSWKQGENVMETYKLPEYIDMDTIQRLIKQYEEEM